MFQHPPQLGWAISAFTATAFTLCSYNCDVSSKRSLNHTRLSSNVNSVVRSYLSPTPVGVGVETSLIWAVHQTLLPARVWLRETSWGGGEGVWTSNGIAQCTSISTGRGWVLPEGRARIIRHNLPGQIGAKKPVSCSAYTLRIELV